MNKKKVLPKFILTHCRNEIQMRKSMQFFKWLNIARTNKNTKSQTKIKEVGDGKSSEKDQIANITKENSEIKERINQKGTSNIIIASLLKSLK